jgi:hypothetical protein
MFLLMCVLWPQPTNATGFGLIFLLAHFSELRAGQIVLDRANRPLPGGTMKKTIICGAVLAASIIPALADQYWVVQDSTSRHCSIVTEKPTTTTTTVVGPLAFQTRTEAENSMKTTKVCTSD